MYKKFEIIHFVGIGGAGMSGIAEVLKNLGYEVRGSDLKESETTKRLESIGINITIGHRAENITNAHVVVVSSAVSTDNPEVIAARNQSIPVIPRAEMLAELARLKYGVLVAGAHGKTTTTSLIASVLASGEFDPTVIIGGKLKSIGSHAKLGQGEFLVAEADESDGSFLKLSPAIAVVTNIDREHMDFFQNLEALKAAFLSFMNKVPFYGLSILCADNEYVRSLLPKVQRRFITYGLTKGLDLVADSVSMQGIKSKFNVTLKGKPLGFFEVPLPGLHNISNCLAAIGVANEIGIDMDTVRASLKNFSGVQRRFEFKGEDSGIKIYDDYGHHPTEILATLKAGKEAMQETGVRSHRLDSEDQGSGSTSNSKLKTQNSKLKTDEGRLVVLFQPHRYTRTRDLLNDFSGAFTNADKVILMDIYPAGEKPINGINSEILFKGIKDRGKDVIYIGERGKILDYLSVELKAGDMLLTLGAGDVWKLGEEFLKNLKCKIKQTCL
ncbi:MAG: UDP-N-acetylmuramate--L-alanine ligase [Nitrospirota bacterium]